MSKYDHLREAAEEAARARQDAQDERSFADNVRFINTPTGQMEIKDASTPDVYAVGRGTVAQENDDGTIGYHPAGVESEPYLKRPVIPGKQLPLGKSGAFRPSDPALHAIRMQNPHLNDYSFQMLGTSPHQIHTVRAIHTPTGSDAGSFSWKGTDYAERYSPGEGRAGEVEMIDVKDQHRGRGLATAMWDYAHFHASREGSEIAHPVHSDNRSIEGNHWAHFVGGAAMARTKGFGVQHY